ncbi:hypothetical protein [Tropicimonas sp. IMCC34043]|nr:hypothetical protein [Tropicimonas sp. IMCC34043]
MRRIYRDVHIALILALLLFATVGEVAALHPVADAASVIGSQSALAFSH